MIKIIFILFISVACARLPAQKISHDEVSLKAALDQAQMSYLKGCVVAFRTFKLTPSFEECKEKSLAHRLELQQMFFEP